MEWSSALVLDGHIGHAVFSGLVGHWGQSSQDLGQDIQWGMFSVAGATGGSLLHEGEFIDRQDDIQDGRIYVGLHANSQFLWDYLLFWHLRSYTR